MAKNPVFPSLVPEEKKSLKGTKKGPCFVQKKDQKGTKGNQKRDFSLCVYTYAAHSENGTLIPSNQVLLGITTSNIDSFYQAPTPSHHPYPFMMLLISYHQRNIQISILQNTDWTTRQDTIAYIYRISPQNIYNQMGMSSTLPCLNVGEGRLQF